MKRCSHVHYAYGLIFLKNSEPRCLWCVRVYIVHDTWCIRSSYTASHGPNSNLDFEMWDVRWMCICNMQTAYYKILNIWKIKIFFAMATGRMKLDFCFSNIICCVRIIRIIIIIIYAKRIPFTHFRLNSRFWTIRKGKWKEIHRRQNNEIKKYEGEMRTCTLYSRWGHCYSFKVENLTDEWNWNI